MESIIYTNSRNKGTTTAPDGRPLWMTPAEYDAIQEEMAKEIEAREALIEEMEGRPQVKADPWDDPDTADRLECYGSFKPGYEPDADEEESI